MAGARSRPPQDLHPIPQDGPPILVAMSAPSGAGKDAVRELLIQWGVPAHFVVTATTRQPRADEVPGVHYHFLSEADFESLVKADGFIEHAYVYGRRYGVPKLEITGPLAAGRDVIVKVDVQGAATLKRLYPDAVLIFISPGDLEVAQSRLQARQTDSPEATSIRIATAPGEMEAARDFDHIVVNQTGRLEEAARRVVEIIAAEKAKRIV